LITCAYTEQKIANALNIGKVMQAAGPQGMGIVVVVEESSFSS
jgi:hypothetical protein